MKTLLLKCPVCKKYTLKTKCSNCGAETVVAHPAKFSPDDKYLIYRTVESYSN